MNKTGIYMVIGLIVLIAIVLFFREKQKSDEIKRQSAKEAQNAALLLGALQYQQQHEQIEAQETASLGDWVNMASNIAGMFSGVSIGGGNSSEN